MQRPENGNGNEESRVNTPLSPTKSTRCYKGLIRLDSSPTGPPPGSNRSTDTCWSDNRPEAAVCGAVWRRSSPRSVHWKPPVHKKLIESTFRWDESDSPPCSFFPLTCYFPTLTLTAISGGAVGAGRAAAATTHLPDKERARGASGCVSEWEMDRPERRANSQSARLESQPSLTLSQSARHQKQRAWAAAVLLLQGGVCCSGN